MYAWVIDKDHLAEPGEKGEAGVHGPYGGSPHRAGRPLPAADELFARLAAGEGVKFRMFDDDGEVYYSGRVVAADGDYTSEEVCAGPLDDFGMPNAGCTHIRYRGHPEMDIG